MNYDGADVLVHSDVAFKVKPEDGAGLVYIFFAACTLDRGEDVSRARRVHR